MMGLGMQELVIVFLIVLVLFGGSRMAGLGKSLGTSIKEFKSAIKEEDLEEDAANTENKEDVAE